MLIVARTCFPSKPTIFFLCISHTHTRVGKKQFFDDRGEGELVEKSNREKSKKNSRTLVDTLFISSFFSHSL